MTITYRPNPEKKSSFLSKVFFFWTNKLIYQGKKEKIDEEDFFDIVDEDKINNLTK